MTMPENPDHRRITPSTLRQDVTESTHANPVFDAEIPLQHTAKGILPTNVHQQNQKLLIVRNNRYDKHKLEFLSGFP